MIGHGEFANMLDGISLSSFDKEEERGAALLAAYALVARLETPWETIARLCMTQPALGASFKVCKDLSLFEKWREAEDKAMSAEDLSQLVPCETVLLERLMRHLASNNLLHESSMGVFEPSSFTKALVDPIFGEWINHLYAALLPTFLKLPEYLSQTEYKVPLDPANGVFQYTTGWRGDLFQYYAAHPSQGETFNHIMGGIMARQAGWLDIYPHQRVIETAVGTGPLLVDVGGNIGYDIERFRQAHPETADRLYLQDRPEVVKLAKCPETVNKMAYDFFTPQPVKHARMYYMHGVLHDWSDESARKILASQRAALKPGYSRLLIHDHVAPQERAHPHTTAYDLTMMVMMAGTERTEAQWRQLLQWEGYKLVQIFSSPQSVQSIIEAELA